MPGCFVLMLLLKRRCHTFRAIVLYLSSTILHKFPDILRVGQCFSMVDNKFHKGQAWTVSFDLSEGVGQFIVIY